jgi:hypothetical protein
MQAEDKVPKTGGVYVVIRTEIGPPSFLKKSIGGWFKGKDPTVPAQALTADWVDGAEVVYIGKADELRRRLGQFAKFGAGEAIGHWGGRLIWQLANSEHAGEPLCGSRSSKAPVRATPPPLTIRGRLVRFGTASRARSFRR